jgi:hypothetical protein
MVHCNSQSVLKWKQVNWSEKMIITHPKTGAKWQNQNNEEKKRKALTEEAI